jgi:hypothetical protein
LPGDDSAFLYDRYCNLKLIDLTFGAGIIYFGKAHPDRADANPQSMVLTSDGEHLFTIASRSVDQDRFGRHKGKIASGQADLKQWSVRGRMLVCDLGELYHAIWSISD